MTFIHAGRLGPETAGASVACAMSSAMGIHEAMPVRTALRLLASSHLREATVIGNDGTPLGIFRDVDGLHAIAAARGRVDGT
jgi:hypothetical protein